MQKKAVILFIWALCPLALIAQGQLSIQDNKSIDSVYHIALVREQGYHWLQQLCKIGPRLSGSENSAKSLKWAVQELSKIPGCKVWQQPVTVPYWNRGKVESARIVTGKFRKLLSAAALGGSIATSKKGLTARVLEVTSFDELRAKSALAKGKIIFFNTHFNKTNLSTFSSYGELSGIRVFGAREAAKVGAVGTLLRSITTKEDNVPHVGVMIYADSVKKIPSMALGIQDADYLHNALLKDSTLAVELKLDCAPVVERQSANIIAEIKGSEKPDEIILMSGHFDSWDKGQGAHDDGAGAIHTMESLFLLQQIGFQPKHTLRFVLFMNEENGSKGAEAYADSTNKNNEKHLAAIESDRGGFTPMGFSYDGDSIRFEKLKNIFADLQRWNLWYFRRGGSGADVGRLKNCIMKLGFMPDSQRYFDVHHSANDVLEAINPRELELGSAANAAFIYILDFYF